MYGVLIEASLHSDAMWKAFVDNPASMRVHRALLLTDSRIVLRETIAKKIASVCGGDLPSTCPLTKGEIAAHFWSVIETILGNAAGWTTCSKQLFEIAEQVFRTNDEYNRSEESLRSLLTDWSGLLLEHKHKEFVGRYHVDHYVLGLTKLLLLCIISLKSLKKPVNAGFLIERVFRKYLFVQRYVHSTFSTTQDLQQ